jgi:3-hydroxyisobutyrate dehydrogenase-like beta-hydroxyacid dehydrogenase
MSGEIKKVAFIGLGKMGTGIAGNILKAGFVLTVYNRTQSKMAPFIAEGATGAATPRAAAVGVDVIITNLMDDQSVMDVVTGEDGLLAGLKPGAVHIGTTTNSPRCAEQLTEMHARHGSTYIAAPVAGLPDAARAGQLRTWVAGNPKAIEACMPLFSVYTSAVTNMGNEPSVANTIKLINNYMSLSMIELMGQVYTLGEKSGIDLQYLNELFHDLLPRPGLKKYATRIRQRDFDSAGFELSAGLKDVELMIKTFSDKRVPCTYVGMIKDKFLAALAYGMEHKDWSSIYEITRMNAGLK